MLLSRATKELSITHIHSTLYQVTEEQLNLKNYGMKISIYVKYEYVERFGLCSVCPPATDEVYHLSAVLWYGSGGY